VKIRFTDGAGQEIPRGERILLFAIVLLAFAFRAALSRYFTGTATDSVLVLDAANNLGHAPAPAPLSLLPALLARVLPVSPYEAGVFVSITAGSLCLIPLYGLVRAVAGAEAAAAGALLFAACPVAVHWQARMDTHALHTLFVLQLALSFLRAGATREAGSVHAVQAYALLAGLSRYEGLAWAAPALWAYLRWIASGWAPRGRQKLAPLLWHAAWIWVPVWLVWTSDGGYGSMWSGATARRLSSGGFDAALARLGEYARMLPELLTPPVAFSALLGLFHLANEGWRRKEGGSRAARDYLSLAAYAIGVHFSHALSPLFRTNHAMPSLAFVCGIAAMGGVWIVSMGIRSAEEGHRAWIWIAEGARRILVALALAWEAVMAVLLVRFQGDLNGDSRRLGDWLSRIPSDVRVVSDERIVTRYHAGREIVPLFGATLREGDLLVLHSAVTDLLPAYQNLMLSWQWETLAAAESRSVAMLPDATNLIRAGAPKGEIRGETRRNSGYRAVATQSVALQLIARR